MHPADSNDGPASDTASEGSSNADDGIAASESTTEAASPVASTDHSSQATSQASTAEGQFDREGEGTGGSDSSPLERPATDSDSPTGVAPDVAQEAGSESGAGTEERAAADSELSVSVLSTPGDGSCGIGTYADSLLEGFEGVETDRLELDAESRSTLSFLRLALRAGTAEGDVIHVQHEYGLFGRHGSRYPGIFGVIFFPVLYLLSRLRRRHVVVTLHSVLRPGAQEAALPVRLYLLLVHNMLAATTDHVVFLSEGCQDRFLADVALDPSEHTLLPHGVDVQEAPDVSTAEAKACFDFDVETTVVMIPGFIRPPKGHDIFIDVAESFLDCEFFIAGGARPAGDDFAFAEEVLDAAPANVTASGVLDDGEFHVALQAADLAFLPYRVVTQSGTFNWCAAYELPVLASDEPYFSRLERRWGNIETVDVEDRAAVVDRIEALLSDPERRAALSDRMADFKAANDFRQVAADHTRIYEHLRGDDGRELTAGPDRPTDGATAGSGDREPQTVGELAQTRSADATDSTTGVVSPQRSGRRGTAVRSNGGAPEGSGGDERPVRAPAAALSEGQWRAACSALRSDSFRADSQ